MAEGVAYTAANANVGARTAFASTAVQLMAGAGLAEDLNFAILLGYAVTRDFPDGSVWLEAWTEATAPIEELGAIHRFLALPKVSARPDFSELSSADRAALASAAGAMERLFDDTTLTL